MLSSTMVTRFLVVKDDVGWTATVDAVALVSHTSFEMALALATVAAQATKAAGEQVTLSVEDEFGRLRSVNMDRKPDAEMDRPKGSAP